MKRNYLGLFSLATLLALASTACSTVPPSQNERRVERLVEELNTADEGRIMDLCALPFLLDGETVAREEDLRILWRNLRAAGFTFADAEIVEIREIGSDSFKTFSDDQEVLAFFKKHTGAAAAVITLKTGHGTFRLLTGGRVTKYGRLPKLYGFAGPEGK
jgi:hypothetical protein